MIIKIKSGLSATGNNTMDMTKSYINSFLGDENQYHGKSDKGFSVSPINKEGEILVNINEMDSDVLRDFMKPNIEIVGASNFIGEIALIESKYVNFKKGHVSNNIVDFIAYMKNKKNLTAEILKLEDTKVHFKGNILNVSNILIRVSGDSSNINKLLYSGIGVGTGHGFGFCKIVKKKH